MASGKTHDQVTYGLLIPTLLLCHWGFDLSIGQSVIITVGVWFGGLFLSPDLDTRSRPFYRWGPLRFIWWPYQWAIPHRGYDSHGLLLAPIFRLVYLSAICIIVYFALHHEVSVYVGQHPTDLQGARYTLLQFFKHHSDELVLLGIGVWLGSLAHVLLDWVSSGFRFR